MPGERDGGPEAVDDGGWVGVVVPWCGGAVVSWCRGAMVPWWRRRGVEARSLVLYDYLAYLRPLAAGLRHTQSVRDAW